MGAVGPNGTFAKTAHYPQAQRINAMLQVYGKYLVHATSTSAVHLPLGYNSTDRFGLVAARGSVSANDATIITGLVCNAAKGLPGCPDPVATYAVGTFLLGDGRVATLVMNQQTEFVLAPTAVLTQGIDQTDLLELDPITGTEHTVVDADPSLPGLQLSMEPATIRFLIYRFN